jgi:hypothetical protein
MAESNSTSVPTRQSTQQISKSSSSIASTGDTSSTAEHDGPTDLEKAQTARSGAGSTATMGKRLSRTQSAGRRPPRGFFQHPLSHAKTNEDVIVDFDGPDDPYRPINWPMRKKVITTILYGLTTMGATWASSV